MEQLFTIEKMDIGSTGSNEPNQMLDLTAMEEAMQVQDHLQTTAVVSRARKKRKINKANSL